MNQVAGGPDRAVGSGGVNDPSGTRAASGAAAVVRAAVGPSRNDAAITTISLQQHQDRPLLFTWLWTLCETPRFQDVGHLKTTQRREAAGLLTRMTGARRRRNEGEQGDSRSRNTPGTQLVAVEC